MVVTPSGFEYVYIRGVNGMVRARAEDASYEVGPGTAAEHAVLEARSWAQARSDRLNPPELMMLQENIADLSDESLAVQARKKLAILENDYGVVLSTRRSYGPNSIEGWSYQAIASVFEGVQNTADALWLMKDRLASYAAPQEKASLFRAVVGPIDIRLASEEKSYFGITYVYDPHGLRDKSYNVILFHELDWQNKGDWFKFNLVHEIAHVIGNRVAGYPVRRVSMLNEEYKSDALFRTQGWGKASGEGWIEERWELRDSATPIVTRQFSHEESDPTYLANEEWADMMLFWIYDDRFGQTTFSHPESGWSKVGDERETYGQVRRRFMERNLQRIFNARYRIRLSPEELVQLAGWASSPELPRVNTRSDLNLVAQMRRKLTSDVKDLKATDINEDHTVVAGALNPGETTTILGRSRWYPHMILNIAEDGEIGWTHIGLLDFSGVDVETLIPLSNDAIDELLGPEDD